MFYREKRWKKHFFMQKLKIIGIFEQHWNIFAIFAVRFEITAIAGAYRIGMIAPGRERGLQAVERILQLG